MAKKLIDKGLDNEFILETTDLSILEIEEIRKNRD